MNSLKAILLKSFHSVFAFVVCLSLFCLHVTFLSFKGPKQKLKSFNSLPFFSLSLHFLKEHFVCEVLLVDAGAKK